MIVVCRLSFYSFSMCLLLYVCHFCLCACVVAVVVVVGVVVVGGGVVVVCC